MSRIPLVRTVFLLALGAGACAGVTPTPSQQQPDGGGTDVPTPSGSPTRRSYRRQADRPTCRSPRPGVCTPSVDVRSGQRAVLRRDRQRLLRHARLRHLPGDQICDMGVCVGGASWHARVHGRDRHYCGSVGNGCGRRWTAASAIPAWSATRASASRAPAARRSPARPRPARYCGTIGDGCGGTLTCGDCPAGSTCGGAGVANTCAPTNCTAGTCTAAGGAHTATIGDGCGRTLDCGGARAAEVCTSTSAGRRALCR